MTSPEATPPQTILDQVDRHASRLLVCLSLLTLSSLVLGKDNPFTEALLWLLTFLGGMVLGIIWCKLAVRRRS